MHMDLTLLHSCTIVSFVTELLCALNHSSNAFALAQVAPQNRLPFDSLSLCVSLSPSFWANTSEMRVCVCLFDSRCG